MGESIFYIRISDGKSQNTARQEKVFEKGYFDEESNTVKAYDTCFTDKASGRSTARPALQEMLRYARKGDHIYTSDLSRLGRNMSELHKLVDDLRKRDIAITFIKERLTIDGDGDAVSNLIFGMFTSIAQFEADLTAERRRAGMEAAIADGRIVRKLTDEQCEEIIQANLAGKSARQLAKEYNVSNVYVSAIVKAYKQEKEQMDQEVIETYRAPDYNF